MSTRGGGGNDQTGRERAPRTIITKFIRESEQAKHGWDAQLAELDRDLAQQRAAQAQSAAAPTPRRAGGNKAPRAAGSAAAAKQRPAATARATASARPVRNAHLDATMKVANKQLKAAASRVKS